MVDAVRSLPALTDALASLAERGAPEARLLHAAFEALPAHLCLLDEHGTLLLVNRAWRQFAADNGGDPAAVCEGSNYLQACGTAAPDFAAELREVLAGRRDACEKEYPCHAPHEERWFVAAATRVAGSGPARAVVAHQSVTSRRRAETEQREQQKMEALGTMASGIAHDFNNVLAAILGHTTMALQDLPPDAPVRDHLAMVEKAARRARGLVQQILAFGRGQPMHETTQAVAPLVHEALGLAQASLPPGVQLRRRVTEEPLYLHAGESEITQVVLNLCSNAWQAMAGQPGVITVGVERSGPSELRLWVADDGPGIDDAVRERIFEPFFTTKPVGQGTGLGLAVVHGVVTRHGGRIELHSVPGHGATFTLWLPTVPAPAEHEAAAPAAAAATRPAPAGARVMVVDDDEVVGLTTAALLRRAGFQVQRVAHPAAALQTLRDSPAPSLLLSDYSMPEMSGLALVRRARALHPTLRCVVISGFIDDELRAELGRGVHALVHKEQAFETLVPTVQRVLTAPADQVSRVQPSSWQA